VKKNKVLKRWIIAMGALCVVCITALILAAVVAGKANAGSVKAWLGSKHCVDQGCVEDGPPWQEVGGTWYWLRSPEEEKRVVSSLFNRYCVRCHGVDGRGVWDIPGVPDFTNARWQAFHTDGQLARSILEGRGAVMPPFRATLSLEEAWAMARYLRSFVPGTEVSRPDYGPSSGSRPAAPPASKGSAAPSK
jgi:hypothetical protein